MDKETVSQLKKETALKNFRECNINRVSNH